MDARNQNFLDKLRGLPDSQKKVILWSVGLVLAGVMAFVWGRDIGNGILRMKKESSNFALPIDMKPVQESLDQLGKIGSLLETTTPTNNDILETTTSTNK